MTVRLSFSPAAVHVRTARLVGVAVARRAGVAEELLEEVRLAIGEACSRAVALHRSHGVRDLVDVVMDDGERFTVRVIDRAGNGPAIGPPPTDPTMFLTEPRSANGSGGPQPAQRPDAPTATLGDGHGVGEDGGDSMNEEMVAARMGLALLVGLVDDLVVASVADGLGTEVSMSWPVERRMAES